MTPVPVNSIQLNNQQTQILAYIDLVIGIASLAALACIEIELFQKLDFKQPENHHINIAIFVLFVLCIVAEIVLAVLVLISSKKNRSYPFRKKILVTIRVFLFFISLCGVIILFFVYIIAAIVGTFILKYKLYSFWVLWSVPENYMSAPDCDKVYIISQQL